MREQAQGGAAISIRQEKLRALRRVRVLELSVIAFVVLIGSAMSLYPGGTWYDASTRGHVFFENFLCDLLHARSLSGGDNVLGARLATLGMVALIPGLVSFVLLVPSLVSIEPRMWRALRVVAILACSLLVSVPLLPSDRYGFLHAAAVLGAGLPATFALSVMVLKIAMVEARSWSWRVLSFSLVVTMLASLGLYMFQALQDVRMTHALPILARCATVLLLVWLFSFGRLMRTRLS
jgi:hypothetical protein